jgi:hypothetical protein
MGAEVLDNGALVWAQALGRGEVLYESSSSQSPRQTLPVKVPRRGVRKLIAWARKRPTEIAPIVLVTAVIAAPLPRTVDRHPSSTPVQQVVAGRHSVAAAVHDEIKYVPEYLTMAQIHELDELFALPAGPEDIIHLDE